MERGSCACAFISGRQQRRREARKIALKLAKSVTRGWHSRASSKWTKRYQVGRCGDTVVSTESPVLVGAVLVSGECTLDDLLQGVVPLYGDHLATSKGRKHVAQPLLPHFVTRHAGTHRLLSPHPLLRRL
jgi:hypothetical protein